MSSRTNIAISPTKLQSSSHTSDRHKRATKAGHTTDNSLDAGCTTWYPTSLHGTSPKRSRCTQASTPIQTAVTEALEQTNRAFEVLTSYCSLNSVIFHEVGKALHEEDSSDYWQWLAHHATHPPAFVRVMKEDIPQQRLLVCRYYAQVREITLHEVCEAESEGWAVAVLPPVPLTHPHPEMATGLTAGDLC